MATGGRADESATSTWWRLRWKDRGIKLHDFFDHVNKRTPIEGGSSPHLFMHRASQEALHIIAELHGGYRTTDAVRNLLTQLTGKSVDASVTVFPPFYCEFGNNLTLGRDVFLNMGCRFQDTGGISIGHGTLIGHGTTLTTLNHALDPARRADMLPAPISIGPNAWLGANVTVVPGVRIRAGCQHWCRCGDGRRCRRHEGRTDGHHRGRCPGPRRASHRFHLPADLTGTGCDGCAATSPSRPRWRGA